MRAAKVQLLASMMGVMVQAMVDSPDQVSVTVAWVEGRYVLNVQCSPEDARFLIGVRGRTARSLRCILGAASAKRGLQCDLDIQA